jgi:hypothetical protein
VLGAARQPFKSTTWHAALTVALARAADGELSRVSRPGRQRFDAAVRRQVARWDAVHPWRKIIDAVFDACADPAGVTALRRGTLERVALLLGDWRHTQARWPTPSSGWSPSWGSWAWPNWPPRSPACHQSAQPGTGQALDNKRLTLMSARWRLAVRRPIGQFCAHEGWLHGVPVAAPNGGYSRGLLVRCGRILSSTW